MSTLVLWDVQIKPGLGQKAEETFVENLPGTRSFKGCQRIDAYRNADDADNLLLVEYWDSIEDYREYVQWRTETGVLPDFLTMCAQDPVTRSYELMDA